MESVSGARTASSGPTGTQRDYLSFSALATYRACPLKYFFRYVAGLPEETTSGAIMLGRAVHACLEWHFREQLEHREVPSVESLMRVYDRNWHSQDAKPIEYARGENAGTLRALAQRQLVAFQRSAYAWPEGRILAVEEETRGTLVPECPPLSARIDLLVDHGDSVAVIDFKTSRSRWSDDQALRSSDQLQWYGELVRQLVPEKTLQLQFVILTKTKLPSINHFTVRSRQCDIQRSHHVYRRVWRAIRAQHFYPCPSPMNCPGCPFREACDQWCG